MSPNQHPPGCHHVETFAGDDDFGAIHDAELWLRARGLATGSPKQGYPTAVYLRGQWAGGSSKWTHIARECFDDIPGYLEGDNRHGPLRLYLSARAGLENTP